MGNLLLVVSVAAVAAVALLGVFLAVRPLRQARAAERLARARRDFHRQREPLDDDVVYARDRRRGQLKALVAIEVSFEAVEGTAMDEEDQAEAVSRVRAATAEFVHDGTRWQTNGRVYFNLAPSATVKYLSSDLEMVAEEHAIPRG